MTYETPSLYIINYISDGIRGTAMVMPHSGDIMDAMKLVRILANPNATTFTIVSALPMEPPTILIIDEYMGNGDE